MKPLHAISNILFMQSKQYQLLSLISFLLNILAISLSLIYFIQPRFNIFFCIISISIPVAFLLNIIVIFLNDFKRQKTVTNNINIIELIYLLCNTIGMLLIPLLLLMRSYSYSVAIEILIVHYVLYFGLLSTGAYIAWRNRQKNFKLSDSSSNKPIKVFYIGKFISRLLLVLFSLFIVVLGILVSILILIKIPIWHVMFISQFAAFLALSFLSAAGIIIKLSCHIKWSIIPAGSFVTGLIIYTICSLPLLLTPYSIIKTQNKFSDVFNSETTKIIEQKTESAMLKSPFNPAAYYLGSTPENYIIKKDVLYYEGNVGVDKGIKLYFDAYMPKQESKALPGNHSVLVWIHGGGWVKYDKGNCSMNKYFASQGYRVFDIQYGLTKLSTRKVAPNEVPEYVRGNFSIDDMVRHIGIFFQYLVNHASEYQADLNSVFITGASAGGHLTCTCALAIASGNYTNIFGSNITVKGFIPFYPANGVAKWNNTPGTEKLINPEYLIDKKSPPCLIYHGIRDSIIPHEIAKSFEKAYCAKADSPCLVISMPLGEHFSDGYFTGYFNQVFLYYMERFMYMYK